MKKLDLKKLFKSNNNKLGAILGLVFFVGLVAVGTAIFSGMSIEEDPLLDTTSALPSESPATHPVSEDSQVNTESGSDDGTGSFSIWKKVYSSRVKPVGVQAATSTGAYTQPATNLPSENPDDNAEETYDPEEEIVDPEDIEEIGDDDISDEEPIDDNEEEEEYEYEDDYEEVEEGEIDPDDIVVIGDNDLEEEIPGDLPSEEELEEFLNG